MTLIKPAPLQRMCVYFFYDPDGIVDDYVLDCLEAMTKHCRETVVVCNGKLTRIGRQRMIQAGVTKIYRRPNVGFDVWAYRHAIEKTGWKRLASFDEVIFMNFTIIGPIYPLSEMFGTMDAQTDLDFWGINTHHGEPYDPWNIMPDGVIPEHLQSHFIAVRRSMLQSEELRHYWETMRPINSYIEAIGFHESIFTPKFEKLGFRWKSYIDTSDLKQITSYPLMFMPLEVLEGRRCPFFKRKAFFLPINEYFGCTNGNTVAETLVFLNNIGYDTKKIFQNINRSNNQYDLRMTTKQFFFSGDRLGIGPLVEKRAARSIALLAYIGDNFTISMLERYVDAIPSQCTLYFVVSENISKIPYFSAQRLKEASMIRGGYLTYSALILNLAKKYDIIGCAAAFYPRTNDHPLLRRSVVEDGFQTLFEDKEASLSTLDVLIHTQHIGLISPIKPMALGADSWVEWSNATYRKTQSLLCQAPIKLDTLSRPRRYNVNQ